VSAPQQISVTGITHGGDGVGRLDDGIAVFVPGALPGETVNVEIVNRKKKFAFGRLADVIDGSPDRVTPPCPHVAEGCGGCDLQHANVDAQRALKTRIVREQLTRLGALSDPNVADCLPAGPATGYRNHARLHVDSRGKVGYYMAGSHEVIGVDPCLVLAPGAQSLLDEFRNTAGIVGLEVRAHDRTGATAVIIEPGPGGLDLPDGEATILLQQPDGSTVTFRGDGELSETVNGRTYRFDATCFFQANTEGADVLVRTVLDAVGDVTGALTWDLYAGVGLLSLPLAEAGAQVVAVEGHGRSAQWLAKNADEAMLPIDVREESITAFLRSVVTADEPDVVVLDPPRTGAGLDVITTIAASRPQSIVYVACDVASLARDVKELARLGYKLKLAQPLDLFPQTHHVEVVATLTR
jgi:tRNA/tmRNA/rRNA uracil-C5-methylase (TrmA/RlmC/RlmD family)